MMEAMLSAICSPIDGKAVVHLCSLRCLADFDLTCCLSLRDLFDRIVFGPVLCRANADEQRSVDSLHVQVSRDCDMTIG